MKHATLPSPDLKPIGIERLLQWAFGAEKAQLDPPRRDDHVEIPRHLGYGSLQNALTQMAILGCRIDVSQAGASFVAHEADHVADDASAVAAVIAGMIGAGMLDRRAGHALEHYGRTGTRPTAMVEAEPRVLWRSRGHNQHGENPYADAVPAGANEYPGGVWRPEMQAIRKKARGLDRYLGHCTPITYENHPRQIASARAAYLGWWTALHQVREALIGAGVLRAHRLTGEMPAAMPWLLPGETGIVETGPRPDWRSRPKTP